MIHQAVGHVNIVVTAITVEDWSGFNASSFYINLIENKNLCALNICIYCTDLSKRHRWSSSRNFASSTSFHELSLQSRSATAPALGQNRLILFAPSTYSPQRQASPKIQMFFQCFYNQNLKSSENSLMDLLFKNFISKFKLNKFYIEPQRV